MPRKSILRGAAEDGFRILSMKPVDGKNDVYYIKAGCTSHDVKKTTLGAGAKIANGSLCHETDTGTVYAFNEYIQDWDPQLCFKEE